MGRDETRRESESGARTLKVRAIETKFESAYLDLGALRANAEKLELMIKIPKTGFFSDFVFELMNRTGRLDRLDRPTTGANQIIAVSSGNQ